MIEFLVENITQLISAIGYFGLLILMAIESTMLPLPSELVMPFAGFLVANGTFSWAGAIIFATIGSLIGSLFSYWLGYHASGPAIRKFGKYFFLNEHHLKQSEQWFKGKGNITIFIGRFVPGVRHVISLPAGAGKMKLLPFCIFTILGAGMWNTVLLYAGYLLQKNWDVVYKNTHTIDLIVVATIAVTIVGYLFHLSRKEKR